MSAIRNIEVMCGTSCCFVPAAVPVDFKRVYVRVNIYFYRGSKCG
jgi:hypothetical protein